MAEGTGLLHRPELAMLPSALPTLEDEVADQRSPVDRLMHAWMGRATGGLSPASLIAAYHDWLAHLRIAPGKQQLLVEKALRKSLRLAVHAGACLAGKLPPDARCIEPLPQDRRFDSPAWRQFPFNLIHQSFLLTQQWWHVATTDVAGVSRHHEDVVSFTARQLLDIVSPSNFIWTNPELLAATQASGGRNLVQGAMNLAEDWARTVLGQPPVGTEAFQVGRDVAVTPGRVVFRNRLIELIQYEPQTESVHPEPILIVPAWIMKYYILDLSPANSLVRWLVERGHTVFVVSWKNPDAGDRDLGMDDYLRLGIFAALDAVHAIVPDAGVHTAGYCLGGTLLAIALAALARREQNRVRSMTMLAAQTDFTDAGELTLFIDESQVTFLEDIMWHQGYLDTRQMAGAFTLLRSNDLIWSRLVHDYLMGGRTKMTDLMAWNADATRMPYRMHSEYLRRLFLNDDLAEGRYTVDGEAVALSDIRVPIFAVGTERDHVAPWRSVYKIHLQTDAEITFLLTQGGHNAGIVSEPANNKRRYRVAARAQGAPFLDPDTWMDRAVPHEGSWWTTWGEWLAARSGPLGKLPLLGHSFGPAPGRYVHVR